MSASPPPSNLLLDPISELTSAIQLNLFGLDSASTHVIIQDSFPITEEDKQRIAVDTVNSGHIGEGVTAKAQLGLKGREGSLVVVLDKRGYTIVEATNTTTKTYPNQTFESLEALLISISPSYVQEMTKEIERRFTESDFGQIAE